MNETTTVDQDMAAIGSQFGAFTLP